MALPHCPAEATIQILTWWRVIQPSQIVFLSINTSFIDAFFVTPHVHGFVVSIRCSRDLPSLYIRSASIQRWMGCPCVATKRDAAFYLTTNQSVAAKNWKEAFSDEAHFGFVMPCFLYSLLYMEAGLISPTTTEEQNPLSTFPPSHHPFGYCTWRDIRSAYVDLMDSIVLVHSYCTTPFTCHRELFFATGAKSKCMHMCLALLFMYCRQSYRLQFVVCILFVDISGCIQQLGICSHMHSSYIWYQM